MKAIRLIILISILFTSNQLFTQYYHINNDLSYKRVQSNDTLSYFDKMFLSTAFKQSDEMDHILLIEGDSVYLATWGGDPSIEALCRKQFTSKMTRINEDFLIRFMYYERASSNDDSLRFLEIQRAEQLLHDKRKKINLITKNQIVFENLVLDLDTIFRGEQYEAVFRFTNRTEKDLFFYCVRPSHRCSLLTWPNYAIPPQSQDSIVVRCGGRNELAKTIHVVTIEHNIDPEPLELQIWADVMNRNKVDFYLYKYQSYDTISIGNLSNRQLQFDSLITNDDEFRSFFYTENNHSVPKFDEVYQIDTLENDNILIEINWRLYYQQLKKNKK